MCATVSAVGTRRVPTLPHERSVKPSFLEWWETGRWRARSAGAHRAAPPPARRSAWRHTRGE